MVQLRLTSTNTAEFTPLGSAGQRSYELIRREAASLGARHEALFAEPFPSPRGDSIDWYSSVRGKVRLIEDLSEPERDAAWEDFNALLSDVAERGQEFAGDGAAERRRLGEALLQAATYPDSNSVYLVGDQPVMICWAHRASSGSVPKGALIGKAAPTLAQQTIVEPTVAEVPPVIAVQSAERQPGAFGWLWWLLWGVVGALAMVIAWLVIPACGVTGVGWLNFCPEPVQSTANRPLTQHQDYLERIERLQRELELTELACRPAPQQYAEDRNEFDERVEQEGGDVDAEYKITLIWDSQNDLDLEMRCPGGQRLYFNQKRQCGATLDIDRNASSTIVTEPVENIAFDGVPAAGTYVIKVNNYKNRHSASNAYKLRIQKGTDVQIITGNVPTEGMFDEYPIELP